MDDRPSVHLENRAAWRAWLEAHHGDGAGVWLVTWKRRTGRPTIPYEEALEEALCFGWIDGQLGRGDDEHSMQWYAPRRPGSTWARSNKERVARLETAGLMTAAGREVIERAKADGSWDFLTDIDAMVVPADLDAALGARAGAQDGWSGCSASTRRMALAWIAQAKRPETRARRIERVADTAAAGRPITDAFRRD
jgi:uncharacterized protein YdeI (YjbR/CyaY-like superfamily)